LPDVITCHLALVTFTVLCHHNMNAR
jgi:hypothetical protein